MQQALGLDAGFEVGDVRGGVLLALARGDYDVGDCYRFHVMLQRKEGGGEN